MDEEIIQQYIDGELSPPKSEAIENHIATCKDCSDRIAEQETRKKLVVDALNILAEPVNDVTLEDISIPYPQKRKQSVLLRFIPLLAAASAILFIVVFFSQRKTPHNGTALLYDVPFAGEIDANKPIIDQELTITVISPDGRITKKVIE